MALLLPIHRLDQWWHQTTPSSPAIAAAGGVLGAVPAGKGTGDVRAAAAIAAPDQARGCAAIIPAPPGVVPAVRRGASAVARGANGRRPASASCQRKESARPPVASHVAFSTITAHQVNHWA